MSSDSDINNPSGEKFRHDEWIGTGRVLPADPNAIPAGLGKLFESLQDVPLTVKAMYPSPDLDVKSFLAFVLPERTYSLPKISADACFSHYIPNEGGEILFSRPLPSRRFIDKLFVRFQQAVLDKMTALVDPAFPGSHLPFWSIQFWKDMWAIYDAREEWNEAVEWLDQISTTSEGNEKNFFICARRSLETLRWNEDTQIAGANRTTTLAFASYLSHNAMMHTAHINMMFAYVSELAGDLEQVKTHVETMRFWHEMDKLKSQEDLNKPSQRFMQRIENRIAEEKITVLIMPCFMNAANHWLTIKLDFINQAVSYGNGLNIPVIMYILKELHCRGLFVAQKIASAKGNDLETLLVV